MTKVFIPVLLVWTGRDNCSWCNRRVSGLAETPQEAVHFVALRVHVFSRHTVSYAGWCDSSIYLPPANEVWDKVVFSQVSVYLLEGGGWLVGFPACITGHMTRGVCIQGRCWADPLHRGLSTGVGGWADHPRDTWDTTGYGQQVGGTYPTGMHSCFLLN